MNVGDCNSLSNPLSAFQMVTLVYVVTLVYMITLVDILNATAFNDKAQ